MVLAASFLFQVCRPIAKGTKRHDSFGTPSRGHSSIFSYQGQERAEVNLEFFFGALECP
jgi:hypothetical protein